MKGFADEEKGPEYEEEGVVEFKMARAEYRCGMGWADVFVDELEDELDELGGESWRHLRSVMRERSAGNARINLSWYGIVRRTPALYLISISSRQLAHLTSAALCARSLSLCQCASEQVMQVKKRREQPESSPS